MMLSLAAVFLSKMAVALSSFNIATSHVRPCPYRFNGIGSGKILASRCMKNKGIGNNIGAPGWRKLQAREVLNRLLGRY